MNTIIELNVNGIESKSAYIFAESSYNKELNKIYLHCKGMAEFYSEEIFGLYVKAEDNIILDLNSSQILFFCKDSRYNVALPATIKRCQYSTKRHFFHINFSYGKTSFYLHLCIEKETSN